MASVSRWPAFPTLGTMAAELSGALRIPAIRRLSLSYETTSCLCINNIDRETHAGCADPNPGTGNQLPGLGARSTTE
jgi:hypothetical protein